VQVRQFGGLGSFSSVNIRGSSSAQVNVYLDGVLVNGAYGGAVDLSQFSLDSVARIEIYRGNTPVQLGPSGVGGSIHIVTADSTGENAGQLTMGLGSFETKKLAASLSNSLSDTRFLLTADYLSSDNDYGLLNNNNTDLNPFDDFPDRRNNASFHQENLLLSAKHPFGNQSSMALIIQHANKNQQLPDNTNSTSNTASFDTRLTSAQLKFDHWLADQSALGFVLFVSDRSELFIDKLSKIGLKENDQEGQTQTYGGAFSVSKPLGAHLINSHIEVKNERYQQTDYIEAEQSEYTRLQVTASLQDEWVSSNGEWLINMAGRLFYLNNSADFPDTRKSSDWYQSVQMGLLYAITPSWQLRSNLSRDIRLPTLWELYGDYGYSLGNEDLLPENATNLDIGLKYNGSEFSGAATFFLRKLDDAVVVIYNARGIGKAENISSARVSGVELEFNYTPVANLQLLNKTTVQQSEDTSDSVFNGRSLPGISTFENSALG